MLLTGKTVVITGARRGMGRAAVTAFAENGAQIYACLRGPDEAFSRETAALSERYGVRIQPVYFDLTDDAAVKAAVKTIMADKQPIDGLVNIAGISCTALFQMTTREKFDEVLNVDFRAPYFFTQSMVRLMQRNPAGKASIVNITSFLAEDAAAGRSAYGAAKAAWENATRVMALELGKQGIRANSIAPGVIDTDMTAGEAGAAVEASVAHTALGRMGKPEEIAGAAVFLISDASSYITGQTLRVDGGMF